MIGIFTFDAPLYCDVNGIYCSDTITNEMLMRYFAVVDKLFLLIRTDHIKKSYKECNFRKLELGEKIEVVELPNPNTPINYICSRSYSKIIKKFVRSADLIFLRIPSIFSNIAANECLKIGKPYFAEVGGCAWDSYFNHSFIGKFVAPFVYFAQKKTVRNASFASYVTEKWLQNRYPTDGISIVASNVYLNFFDDNNIEERIKRYSQKLPDRYRLGTTASVDVRYKGQEFVIRAIAKLKKEQIMLDYDLVGSGDTTFLSSLAKSLGVENQVHFLGVKLHEDIWKWLDTIDIYAQPSKQEGLPRAVIEAMNRGCLAIGSNVAGIPELLEADMIFKADSVDEICNIIKKLIREKNHERRIRRNYLKTFDFKIDILEQRRKNIFCDYKHYILKKNE